MDTIAQTAALNTTGIPTGILVLLVMAIAIGSVVLIKWLYEKFFRK